MNTKETDILNIILIIVSLVLAFNMPFGLFLFAYAVLGPLHYLTEINWLKEKNYFIHKTNWMWLYIFFALLLSIPFFISLPILYDFSQIPTVKKIGQFIISSIDEIVLMALLFAIGLIYFKNKMHLILFLTGSIVSSILILNYLPANAIFAVFIPTILHVYLFTLLFMIYGTLNSKSTPGIVAILLQIAVPIIIIVSKIDPLQYNAIGNFTKNAFNDSGFGNLNVEIARFTQSVDVKTYSFLSVLGIKIQIFIAFAYTYHYLNWFSKTSIIRWEKNLSKSKIITILCIWAFSIGLYVYNYKIGVIILSFLSLIHVFLEFPLNITCVKGILVKVKSQFAPQS